MNQYDGTVGQLAESVGQALASIHHILAQLVTDADVDDLRLAYYRLDLDAIKKIAAALDPNL